MSIKKISSISIILVSAAFVFGGWLAQTKADNITVGVTIINTDPLPAPADSSTGGSANAGIVTEFPTVINQKFFVRTKGQLASQVAFPVVAWDTNVPNTYALFYYGSSPDVMYGPYKISEMSNLHYEFPLVNMYDPGKVYYKIAVVDTHNQAGVAEGNFVWRMPDMPAPTSTESIDKTSASSTMSGENKLVTIQYVTKRYEMPVKPRTNCGVSNLSFTID